MKPNTAWALVVVLAAVTVAVFVLDPAFAAGIAVVAGAGMRKGRSGLVVFFAITAAINALLLAWLAPGPDVAHIGPLVLGRDGALRGLVGAVRLTAILAANLAVLTRVSVPAWIDGLHLPRSATAFVAAVFVAAHDLRQDYLDLQEAARLDTGAPRHRVDRWRLAASTAVPLLMAAHRRAHVRRDALSLVGIATGPRFAPVVAITALAVAGRLAFIALPNVSLTYVVVFLGGLVYGARVGAWAGLWSMLLTDLILSGLLLTAFVNVPAMALVGATGGLLRRFAPHPAKDMATDRLTWTLLAASTGVLATFAFSISADALEWLLVPEFRGQTALLKARVLAGLAFNALPAATNGFLFAAAAGPVLRAFAALPDATGHGGQRDQQKDEEASRPG